MRARSRCSASRPAGWSRRGRSRAGARTWATSRPMVACSGCPAATTTRSTRSTLGREAARAGSGRRRASRRVRLAAARSLLAGPHRHHALSGAASAARPRVGAHSSDPVGRVLRNSVYSRLAAHSRFVPARARRYSPPERGASSEGEALGHPRGRRSVIRGRGGSVDSAAWPTTSARVRRAARARGAGDPRALRRRPPERRGARPPGAGGLRAPAPRASSRRSLADLPKLPASPAQQKAELVGSGAVTCSGGCSRRPVAGWARFVVCTAIWVASGASGFFWPIFVALAVLIPLLRNGWRLYGPAPELDRVERELESRRRGRPGPRGHARRRLRSGETACAGGHARRRPTCAAARPASVSTRTGG